MSPRRPKAILIDLARYRTARRARDFAASTFYGAPWVLGVRVRLLADGSPRLVIQTTPITDLQRRCLPSAVDKVAVVVEESA